MSDDRIEALVAEDTDRMRKLLAVVITACGLTRQDVDERLGAPRGYTASVLSGRRELKSRHVTAFLLSLGVHPSLFFDILYPRELPIGPVSATEDFARRLEVLRLTPRPQPSLPAPSSLSREELIQLVEATVRKALGTRQRTPANAAAARKRPRRTKKRG